MAEIEKVLPVPEALRPDQAEIVDRIVDSDHMTQFGRMPTGWGKTTTQAGVIQRIEGRSLTITPRAAIVDHIAGEYKDRLPGFTITKSHSKIPDREKSLDGSVVVTTFATALLGLASGRIDASTFTNLHVDEAHHFMAERTRTILDYFKHAKVVGWTATPGYGVNRHLRDLLGHQFADISIRQAVESDHACSLSAHIIRTGLDLDDVPVTGSGPQREFKLRELAQKVNTGDRNQTAIEIYKLLHMGEKALAFCAGIAHAKDLAHMYRESGVKAEAVWGKMPAADRRDIDRRNARGELDLLTSADLLVEGYNDPRISVILNLRPTLSPVVAEQRGGRATRIVKGWPDKYAHIYDWVDRVSRKSRQPVTYAQVAEAARLTNSWHKSQSEPTFERIREYEAATGVRVYWRAQEVMWAVNNAFRELAPYDSSIWKTLHRVAAETGVSLGILEMIDSYVRNDLNFDPKDMKMMDIRSPHGIPQRHYSPRAVTEYLYDILVTAGYVSADNEFDFGTTQPEEGDLIVKFTGNENPYFNGPHADYYRRLRREVERRKVDTEFLHQYLENLYRETGEWPEEWPENAA